MLIYEVANGDRDWFQDVYQYRKNATGVAVSPYTVQVLSGLSVSVQVGEEFIVESMTQRLLRFTCPQCTSIGSPKLCGYRTVRAVRWDAI